jgi:hypothetical protein
MATTAEMVLTCSFSSTVPGRLLPQRVQSMTGLTCTLVTACRIFLLSSPVVMLQSFCCSPRL